MDIDTIKLKFAYPRSDNKFFKDKLHQKNVWTNNTWRKELQARGVYAPKFWFETDYKNENKTYFCFEASIPKFINSSNLISIKDYQFNDVVNSIVDFCKPLGVYLFPNQIKDTIPNGVAIGTNINLTSICTVDNALKVLKPFDYKSHSKHRLIDFSDHKHGGKEIIFSFKTETFKAYNKSRELLNNAKTNKELEISSILKNGEYIMDGQLAIEVLRLELTLKNKTKVKSRFRKYLGELPATFENIFKEQIWESILKDEINNIFNHPLQKIIFISLEKQPVIDRFLNDNYKHIQTRAMMRDIIMKAHEKGLAEVRNELLNMYKSRQTWYNYLHRLNNLQKYFDWSTLSILDNVKIHSFIMDHFGITTRHQEELSLKFNPVVSKNIDNKPCNTGRYYD